MRVVLVVTIEGAQNLFVRYLDHKTNASRKSVAIKGDIPPARSNVTSIDEVYM